MFIFKNKGIINWFQYLINHLTYPINSCRIYKTIFSEISVKSEILWRKIFSKCYLVHVKNLIKMHYIFIQQNQINSDLGSYASEKRK